MWSEVRIKIGSWRIPSPQQGKEPESCSSCVSCTEWTSKYSGISSYVYMLVKITTPSQLSFCLSSELLHSTVAGRLRSSVKCFETPAKYDNAKVCNPVMSVSMSEPHKWLHYCIWTDVPLQKQNFAAALKGRIDFNDGQFWCWIEMSNGWY